MFTTELKAVLVSLSQGVRCSDVLIRFECENLETVYVLVEGDRLVVTDRGETFTYLQGAVPVSHARLACNEFDVEIDGSNPELYPRIRRVPGDGENVQRAIDAVADAIEAVHALE